MIRITIFSPFVVKTPKREKTQRRCMRHVNYSSSSISLSSLVASSSSSSSSLGAQAGPMPKAAKSARHRGHQLEGRWAQHGTQEAAHPTDCDNLLVAPTNLKALLHHIHAPIRAMAHGEDTPEHLQEAGVGARGRGGTTTTGSTGRSHSWRRRSGAMSPWILGNCGAKRLMSDILVELLIGHHLKHVLNVGSKSTRSLRVGGYVPWEMYIGVISHGTITLPE
jgi:hypothetical protein